MKLIELKVENFRCYQNETTIRIDDLTTLIGKNDIGKSTILEALDAFFNNNIEAGDVTIGSASSTVQITCKFSNISDSIVLDSTVITSLSEEGLLNVDGHLEVCREFSFGGRMSKATFLIANHPSASEIANILTLKNADLKAMASELEVDLSNVNRTKNPELRQAIRQKVGGVRSAMRLKVEGTLDTNNNLKAIWSSLSKYLPIYSIFKVDKSLSDKDADVQDPMKSAIKQALSLPDIEAKLQEIENRVREEVTAVAEETIANLANIDSSLAESLRSEFSKDPSYSSVFNLSLLDQHDIPVNKRGSGVRRLILLSFFQAQAERKKADLSAPAIIYALEEPEASQHPNHQLILIEAMKRLSDQDDTQVIFTTHSANLAREIPVEALRFLHKNAEDDLVIDMGTLPDGDEPNEGIIQEVINTLGLLPNPADKVRVILYVEGPNDIEALKRYSEIISESPEHNPGIRNFCELDSIGYVVTGGSTLKDYINKKYLHGLGKPEVHIYDGDVGSYRNIVERMNRENNPLRIGFITQKLMLENYLHHEAIISAYQNTGRDTFEIAEITDDENVPEKVAKALHENTGLNWDSLTDDKKKDKKSRVKKFLNTKVLEHMTADLIDERGGIEEIREWFIKILSYC